MPRTGEGSTEGLREKREGDGGRDVDINICNTSKNCEKRKLACDGLEAGGS